MGHNSKTNTGTPINITDQLLLAEPASPPSLQDEIEILRATLKWLQDTFTRSDSTVERLKLSNSICLVSASLFYPRILGAKLHRTQTYLLSRLPSAFNTALNQVLFDILKEWGRT
jgi:hypothetical protein